MFKLIKAVTQTMVLFGGLLLLPAGTWRWPRAWWFLGVVFVGTVATVVSLLLVNEDLLNERMKPAIQKSQPLPDKILTVLLLIASFGLTIFIPLDVFRFHLLRHTGLLAASLGMALFICGWCIITAALLQNPYAAPVVKYQEERRQTVVVAGMYSVVRHPMYAGAIAVFIGMPLWLGSYAAAFLAAAPISVLAARMVFEEKFLREKLDGYGDYTRRVRRRLVPFVW
ncbi:MAG: isoprenylcysteine carboxylmethyltransferase family protein [Bryobacteraceae bacterium]